MGLCGNLNKNWANRTQFNIQLGLIRLNWIQLGLIELINQSFDKVQFGIIEFDYRTVWLLSPGWIHEFWMHWIPKDTPKLHVPVKDGRRLILKITFFLCPDTPTDRFQMLSSEEYPPTPLQNEMKSTFNSFLGYLAFSI